MFNVNIWLKANEIQMLGTSVSNDPSPVCLGVTCVFASLCSFLYKGA